MLNWFFVHSILTDRYIHLRESSVVSLESLNFQHRISNYKDFVNFTSKELSRFIILTNFTRIMLKLLTIGLMV